MPPLRLVYLPSAARSVIDLNDVRLRTLLAAVRHVRAGIAARAHCPPEWLDPEQRVRWAFMLGEVHRALEELLRRAGEDAIALPSLEAYRRARAALVCVAHWCEEPGRSVDLAEALALELVSEMVAPRLDEADRAPRWLRGLGA